MTVYGDGNQTRSFCFVDDEVRGLLALLDSDYVGPVNIGNPDEYTVNEFAEIALRGHGQQVRDRARAVARRRPDAAPPRHHAGRDAPRVGADDQAARGARSAPPTTSARCCPPTALSATRRAVVVNYNAGDYVVECVRSLRGADIDEVVVADNASTDGSLAALRALGSRRHHRRDGRQLRLRRRRQPRRSRRAPRTPTCCWSATPT